MTRGILFTILATIVASISVAMPVGQVFVRQAPSIAAASKVVGSSFRECAECPEMVVLSAGSYLMGSPSSEELRSENEGPQHKVTIGQAFAIGRYDVTVAEYRRFAEQTGRMGGGDCLIFSGPKLDLVGGADWRRTGLAQTLKDPVVCVGWEDAQAYARWLNSKLSLPSRPASARIDGPYRLLTEAEWEYAARGGTTTRFYWGDSADVACSYANIADMTMMRSHPGLKSVSCNDNFATTSPVGSFAPNGFGLFDMTGNVFQWVQDCYHNDYQNAPVDGSSWGEGACDEHVIRGGSWAHVTRLARTAYRFKDPTEHRSIPLGFRVARTLD